MRHLSTPVVLVMFNRPKTTRLVFERISQAKPKKLYLIGDGPRENRPREKHLVEQCREIVSQIDWPCEVLTKYSHKNLGCKASVVEGIDWVFGLEEEAIILEDDCVPTLGFFEFCQEMLDRYRNNPDVGTVCGSNLEHVSALQTDLSYWFSKYPEVWGWATWRRAWVKYEAELAVFPRSTRRSIVNEITKQRASRRYWNLKLDSVASGKLDTWDYQLAFMHWKNNLLSVIPSVNLVSNIGFGPDATHTFSPPSAKLKLATGQLELPMNGPLAVESFVNYDEMVVRNRFSLSRTKYLIEFLYFLSPESVQSLARQLFASLARVRAKSKK